MKKYLLLLLIIMFSCSKKTEDKQEVLVLSEDYVSANYADSVEIALVKTKDIDVDIKQKIKQVEVLSSENNNLKDELKTTKDCLVSTQERFEIFKTNSKVPKKRSFFQKLVGAKADSVEIQKIDTLKN
jgi:hypothetical protein